MPAIQKTGKPEMDKIRIAVNEEISSLNGKPDFANPEVRGQLTWNYSIKDLTYEGIKDIIQKGYSITNIFGKGVKYNFHRKKEYFLSADFFGLDFDNDNIDKTDDMIRFSNVILGTTQTGKFIKNNAFLVYTTPSHTEEINKFRALFHLPERLTDPEEFKRIVTSFMNEIPEVDQSCKDPARYFNGMGKNGVISILGNRLTQKTINKLLEAPNKPVRATKTKDNIKTLPEEKNTEKTTEEAELYVYTVNLPQSEWILKKYLEKSMENKYSELGKTQIHSRDNKLNSISYEIGIWAGFLEKQSFKFVIINTSKAKERLIKIGNDLGKLDNYQSLTKEKIASTVKKSFNDGFEGCKLYKVKDPESLEKLHTKQFVIRELNTYDFKTKNGKIEDQVKAEAYLDKYQELYERSKEIKRSIIDWQNERREDYLFYHEFSEKAHFKHTGKIKIVTVSKMTDDSTEKQAELSRTDGLMMTNSFLMRINQICVLYDSINYLLSLEPGKVKRSFANPTPVGFFAVNKEIADRLNFDNINEEHINNSITNQIPELPGIRFDTEVITREFMTTIHKKLKDPDTIKGYLNLWNYADDQHGLYLENVCVNDIIQATESKKIIKQEMVRKRKDFIENIKLFSVATLLKETPSDEEGVFNISGLHLIENFHIYSEKGKTYITCQLPWAFKQVASFFPKQLGYLGKKDRKATKLALALFIRAGQKVRYRNKSGEYKDLNYDEFYIDEWSLQTILEKADLIRVYEKNKNEAIKLLEEILNKLKGRKIISKYSAIPSATKPHKKMRIWLKNQKR